MNPLTPIQEKILAFIVEYIDKNKLPPSRAEIADRFGFKTRSGAQCHLHALQKKGRIELIPAISRGLRVLAK